MKKKYKIILGSVVAICALCLVSSLFIDWPVDMDDAGGDIAKSARFSRKQATEKLTNMEELLQNDAEFKDGIIAAQAVMQARALQFGTLVEMSNDAVGDIPAFADVLKDMNANMEMVSNVNSSLMESSKDLNAALEGEECPDLAQKTINASLAYTTLQKQNKLATLFIETTDKYLETAQGDDRLKFVRDQWLEYQQMTAALEGDKASAEALAKKGVLLKGDKVISALASFSPIQQAATITATTTLNQMGAPSELCLVVTQQGLNEILTVGRNSATIEQQASGQDLNNNPSALFAQSIRQQVEAIITVNLNTDLQQQSGLKNNTSLQQQSGLKNNTSLQQQSGLKNNTGLQQQSGLKNNTGLQQQSGLKNNTGLQQTALRNQGALEMSGKGRGSVYMAYPDLNQIATLFSSYNTIVSQSPVVKQNTSLSLATEVGEIVKQTAMGNKAELGAFR